MIGENWPAWLKCGIFGEILFFIFFLLTFIIEDLFIGLYVIFLLIILILNINQINNLLFEKECTGTLFCLPKLTILGVITLFVFWSIISFLVGAFIGWIYGKIRSK